MSLTAGVLSGWSVAALAERRVIGGSNAQPGAWSWMVSVQNASGHFCGGSLIDAYWVMTAAHCVNGLSASYRPGLRVAIGLYQRLDIAASELIQVERFIQHPQWDTYNYDSPNDIALLQLSSPATSQPVKLAQPDSTVDSAGRLATALGWGVTTARSNSPTPDVLQQVEMPLVSLTACQQVYQNDYHLIDSQLCAGVPEGGKDTCFGDSGGPLAVFDGQAWRQVGITSFGGKASGPPCAGAEAYGVYSRVSAFVDFVQSYVLSDLQFSSVAQFRTGETWQMRVQEKNPTLHPRPAVDLWFGVEFAGLLWFISGTPQQPVLSLDARPWSSALDSSQSEYVLLNLQVTAKMQGSYQFYAIFTLAGQGFAVETVRSSIASQLIKLNP